MTPLSIEQVIEKNNILGRGRDSTGAVRPFTPEEFLEISHELGATQLYPPYRALHEHLAKWISNELKVKSTLEIGSGPGYLLNCLLELGVNAEGLDGSEVSRQFFLSQHPKHFRHYGIDPVFSKNYSQKDAVLSIEVFEHIPDDGLLKIMKKIRDEIKPKYVVFSSTPNVDPNPNWDIQWGHINIKQPEEWRALFKEFGFEVDDTKKPPVTEWADLYKNTNTAKLLPKYYFKL